MNGTIKKIILAASALSLSALSLSSFASISELGPWSFAYRASGAGFINHTFKPGRYDLMCSIGQTVHIPSGVSYTLQFGTWSWNKNPMGTWVPKSPKRIFNKNNKTWVFHNIEVYGGAVGVPVSAGNSWLEMKVSTSKRLKTYAKFSCIAGSPM